MTTLSSGFKEHARILKSPAQKRRRLLVVDDEEAITSSIADLFRSRYQVITAQSAEEALQRLETTDFDVIISDQRMPNMTGTELFARIATTKPETTRILLTGYADLESVVAAVNQGQIYSYLTKPWKSGELEASVNRAFEYHTLLRERRSLLEELREANLRLEEKISERTRELREKNSALEVSNKVKNEFLGVATHDLRSPLGSIRTMADLLLHDTTIGVEDRNDFLALIYSTSDQMLHMVDHLLDLSRIEAGKIDLQLASVGPTPALSRCSRAACSRDCW